MKLNTISEAVAALKSGKPVLVADDENRENEGDVIIAAEFATPEWIAWIVKNTSGYLCAPMPAALADRLELPLMVPNNQDPRKTSYTVSVDAAEGVSTGISASDRARTLRVLADPESTALSLIRPGHILPLRAKDGGVLVRAGHTEAAVDLLKLAELTPVGVIAEVVRADGEMMRLPELIELGAAEQIPVITIAQLIAELKSTSLADSAQLADSAAVTGTDSPTAQASWQQRVRFEVETTIPTDHGTFKFRAYRDLKTGVSHLAVLAGDPKGKAIVRMHSECLTGEAFGSNKCECGPQLDAALQTIQSTGGVVIYLRGQEGRGIGLVNKLKAYRLQEDGQDTLQANLSLGLPADAREYGAAAAILEELGIDEVELLTNNPEKEKQLVDLGIKVSSRIPLIVGLNETNRKYLEAKRDRMGHLIPEEI